MGSSFQSKFRLRLRAEITNEVVQSVNNELKQFSSALQSRLIREALVTASDPLPKMLAAAYPVAPKQAIRKDGTPRPHIRDSILRKIRRYRNRKGYYVVIGASSRMPHAHLIEKGTKLRIRKRMSGWYRGKKNKRWLNAEWFEPLSPLYRYSRAGMERPEPQRLAGTMPAFHVVEKVAREAIPLMHSRFIESLQNKIRRKIERMMQSE